MSVVAELIAKLGFAVDQGTVARAEQALKRIGEESKGLESKSSTITPKVDTHQAENKLAKLAEGFEKLMQFAGGIGLAEVGRQLLEMGNAANETQDTLRDLFGADGAARVNAWADQFASAAGQSRFQMRKFAEDLGVLLEPALGHNSAAAENMSEKLVEVAVNLGAMKNIKPEQAVDDMRSALAGSTEVLAKYGIRLQENVLKEKARKQGLSDTISELTQTQKTQLIYNTILEQSAKHMGRAAAESHEFGGASVALQGRLHDLGVTLGQSVIGPATQFLNWANSAVVGLQDLVEHTDGAESAMYALAIAAAALAAPMLASFAVPAAAAAALVLAISEIHTTLAGGDSYIRDWLNELYGVEGAQRVIDEFDEALKGAVGTTKDLLTSAHELHEGLKPLLEVLSAIAKVVGSVTGTVFGGIYRFAGQLGLSATSADERDRDARIPQLQQEIERTEQSLDRGEIAPQDRKRVELEQAARRRELTQLETARDEQIDLAPGAELAKARERRRRNIEQFGNAYGVDLPSARAQQATNESVPVALRAANAPSAPAARPSIMLTPDEVNQRENQRARVASTEHGQVATPLDDSRVAATQAGAVGASSEDAFRRARADYERSHRAVPAQPAALAPEAQLAQLTSTQPALPETLEQRPQPAPTVVVEPAPAAPANVAPSIEVAAPQLPTAQQPDQPLQLTAAPSPAPIVEVALQAPQAAPAPSIERPQLQPLQLEQPQKLEQPTQLSAAPAPAEQLPRLTPSLATADSQLQSPAVLQPAVAPLLDRQMTASPLVLAQASATAETAGATSGAAAGTQDAAPVINQTNTINVSTSQNADEIARVARQVMDDNARQIGANLPRRGAPR